MVTSRPAVLKAVFKWQWDNKFEAYGCALSTPGRTSPWRLYLCKRPSNESRGQGERGVPPCAVALL